MRSQAPLGSVRVPLATFRLWTRYFRYEVDGFDVLATCEPAIVVAYHGGPWTFDLWMLATRMYDELGYFPRACWHPGWWRIPAVGRVVSDLGGLPRRPTAGQMEALKARGEHIVFAPGGPDEGLRPFWDGHRVDFGRRRGYARLAVAHDMPVVPVVASGLEKTFVGLTTGAPWLALGVGGVWPLALPFPVKIRQRVGAPIRAGRDVEALHGEVTSTLQSMLDDVRSA
jgi:1-acyl-sn-glycerol-3-phosphate acyltransferase